MSKKRLRVLQLIDIYIRGYLLLFAALERKGRNYRKTWFTAKEESNV
jgi:hypothetical protein|nr:hypothetical protein [uncultured Lachnoclostridium sp.]